MRCPRHAIRNEAVDRSMSDARLAATTARHRRGSHRDRGGDGACPGATKRRTGCSTRCQAASVAERASVGDCRRSLSSLQRATAGLHGARVSCDQVLTRITTEFGADITLSPNHDHRHPASPDGRLLVLVGSPRPGDRPASMFAGSINGARRLFLERTGHVIRFFRPTA